MRNKMLVYIVWVFMLALGVQSCNNDPMPDAPKGKYPILFRCSDETRAVATVESMKADTDGFNVYAYFETNTNEKVSFEKNVWWNESEGMWLYDDIEYWIPGATYWFKAVYPFDAPYSIIKDISGNPTGISCTFTTPEKADQDIVAANATYTTAETTPESVVMDFKHILARVYFKIDYDTTNNKDDEFTIKEFSISNIKKEGTLQSSFNIDNPHSWSVNPLQNMTFKWIGEEEVPVLSLWGEEGLMLIPQTIAPGVVNINVKYTYRDHYVVEGKDGEQIADPVDKEVDTYLPAITWQPGQQYTYTMTLHEDDLITFRQIEVATWGSPQQGGAIIIK